MSNKIETIQILRGFAALVVVLNHLWVLGPVSRFFGFNYIGGLGVDVFFVISGFIMCYSIDDNFDHPVRKAGDFLARRILRVFPPYWLVAAPLIAIYIRARYRSGIGVDPWLPIGNIFLLPSFSSDPNYRMALPVAWTLVYEMMFYVIFSVSMIFSKNKNQAILIFSSAIFALVFFSNALGLKGERLWWVNISYILGDTLLINFVLGGVAYSVFKYFSSNKRINFYFSVAIVLLISYLSTRLAIMDFQRFIRFGIPSFVIFMVCIFSEVQSISSIIKNFLFSLGNASYSIYLTHFYLHSMAQSVANKVPYFMADLVGFLFTVSAIVVGFIFYNYIERNLTRVCVSWYKNFIVR